MVIGFLLLNSSLLEEEGTSAAEVETAVFGLAFELLDHRLEDGLVDHGHNRVLLSIETHGTAEDVVFHEFHEPLLVEVGLTSTELLAIGLLEHLLSQSLGFLLEGVLAQVVDDADLVAPHLVARTEVGLTLVLVAFIELGRGLLLHLNSAFKVRLVLRDVAVTLVQVAVFFLPFECKVVRGDLLLKNTLPLFLGLHLPNGKEKRVVHKTVLPQELRVLGDLGNESGVVVTRQLHELAYLFEPFKIDVFQHLSTSDRMLLKLGITPIFEYLTTEFTSLDVEDMMQLVTLDVWEAVLHDHDVDGTELVHSHSKGTIDPG